MLKDIPKRKVEDLAIAVMPPESGDLENDLWDVVLLNLHEYPILSVLVSVRGYGEIDGEQRKTATMRYFIEELGPLREHKLEPIQATLFDLNNEYWVSFSLGNHLYDKKYIFVRGSITPENFTTIPFYERKGVLIR